MEKNIFLLPTKESHLFYHDCIKNYSYKIDKYNKCKETKCKHPQNIYITNDEKVEIGEYGLGYAHGIKNGVGSGWFLFKHDGSNQAKLNALCTDTKKIIITNDSELIDSGVQAIDDKFLEWFIKNPSFERVEIQKWASLSECGYSYHIIIPKEETKTNLERLPFPELVKEFAEYYKKVPLVEETKQETLEEPDKWSLDSAKEFALNYFKKSDEVPSKGMFTYELLLRILEAGIECGYKFGTKASAKYSEEDMFEFSQWVSNEDWVYLPSKGYWVNEEQEELDQRLSSKEILDLWFEQYKKNTL
jgi:hypothetical protein